MTNTLHAERDAVALEMLMALANARDAIQRAMNDGLLPEPLWLGSHQPLLSYLDAVIGRGHYAWRPLTGAPTTTSARSGAAGEAGTTAASEAWRSAFDLPATAGERKKR